MSDNHNGERWFWRALVAGEAVVFAVVWGAASWSQIELLVLVAIAYAAAAGGLLAIYLALSPGPSARRWPPVLFGAVVVGYIVAGSARFVQRLRGSDLGIPVLELVAVVIGAVVAVMACALPLLIARWAGTLRIVRFPPQRPRPPAPNRGALPPPFRDDRDAQPAVTDNDRSSSQFTVGQILLWTAGVAVLFGVGRLLVAESRFNRGPWLFEAFFIAVLGGGMAGGVTALATAPWVWSVLLPRFSGLALGIALGIWFGAPTFLFLIVIATAAPYGRVDPEAFWILVYATGAQLACTMIVVCHLLAARAFGWRLVHLDRPPPVVGPPAPPPFSPPPQNRPSATDQPPAL